MKQSKCTQMFGALILSLCMLLSLTACGNTSTEETTETKIAEESIDERASGTAGHTSAKLRFGDPYSEDLAWVLCEEDGTTYSALIDKKGNAIVRFTEGVQSSPYFEGYSHIGTANGYYLLNSVGDVVRQYSSSEEEIIEARGGYVVTRTDVSGFDAVGYHYTIYNPDGSILEEFDHEDDESCMYCGHGVFWFCDIGYYCAQNDSWNENVDIAPSYYDDIAAISYVSGDNHTGGMVMMTPLGEETLVHSNYLSEWMTATPVINNVCVLYERNSPYITALNLATMEEYPIPEEYGDALITDVLDSELLSPYDNRIVARMEGADGDIYTAVFDTQMNLIIEPVRGFAKAYSDGRMVLDYDDDTAVYDTDGNIIFTLSEKGYMMTDFPLYGRYSNGALYVHEQITGPEHDYAYLDTDGNLLFEDINLDNVKTIEI